jgi:WD40 repeat protein
MSQLSIAFSPNGQTLASGSIDETIKLWNWRTGEIIRTFTGHSAIVWSVAFSPDGQTLASGSHNGHDGTIKIWRVSP